MTKLVILTLLTLAACGNDIDKVGGSSTGGGSTNRSDTGSNTTADADSPPASTTEIADQILTGEVAGEQFTFMSGSARDLFDDGDYFVDLFGEDVDDPCNSGGGSPSILFSSDLQPSDSDLSLSNNITFAYGGGNNDVATKGHLRIDGVADGRLTGGLVATMGEHYVNGLFDVVVCN